jgi:hypothetical protein
MERRGRAPQRTSMATMQAASQSMCSDPCRWSIACAHSWNVLRSGSEAVTAIPRAARPLWATSGHHSISTSSSNARFVPATRSLRDASVDATELRKVMNVRAKWVPQCADRLLPSARLKFDFVTGCGPDRFTHASNPSRCFQR